WKSGGDTDFAPLASATGALEASGFWEHGQADKYGVWTENARRCPSLVRYVEDVGATFGRVRVIRLQPSDEAGALANLHTDDNNKLNPAGAGRVVRSWLELSDAPDARMILRATEADVASEVRIPLGADRQLLV